jgi:hypothetical protein
VTPVRSLGVVLAGVALVTLTVVAQDAALRQRQGFGAEQDQLYLPRASALRALSLGHHELAADLVFIRAIVYFGGQFSAHGEHRWLENYLDTIVQLDPKWKTPYRWAGVSTMYDGREITNQSVRQSSHFLDLGVKQFPEDWELPFMLGCNWLFEMKPASDEERKTFRRIGGEYVRHAALVGGGPSWLPLLAATILKEEGDEEAAVKHLEQVYRSTTDEKTRQEVRNRLVSLHAKIDLEKVERDRLAFESAWKRALPYVPAELFVVVGPKSPPRLDLPYLKQNELVDLPANEEP